MAGTAVTDEEIKSVAALNIVSTNSISLTQTRHRFDLIARCNIPKGAHVLEIGCGQGDCTAVLAHIVGPSGHVTAVDPAPGTYGSPYTLAQAQQHLSKGVLGSRINWVEADPVEFLKPNPSKKYDFAVLAHCIWYFASPTTLQDILHALASRAATIVLVEWGLTVSSAAAMPHLLAAFAHASLYPHLPFSHWNIRAILSPSAIRALAARAGLALITEEVFAPTADLQDGGWEVSAVTDTEFCDHIEQYVKSEKERAVLYAMVESISGAANALKSQREKVQCMNVWKGVFVSKVAGTSA